MTASPEHCHYCFDVIHAHFRQEKPPIPTFESGRYALFVTWNKTSRSRGKRLRGCIGSLQPLDLHEGLVSYSKTSAFRDRRFDPVNEKELPQLHCAVSLLSCFENGKNYLDWEIGTHGIIISFYADGSHRSATYLPEVCRDEQWTKEYCIESLIRKAGFNGHVTQDLLDTIRLERYQSTKYEMSYEDYHKRTLGFERISVSDVRQ
eukprot:Rmarinus@m.25724